MHGNPCQQRGQTPFALEPRHELRSGQQRQDPAGDASPEIDAACRQHLHRQVSGLCSQDGDEHLQRQPAERRWRLLQRCRDDDRCRIAGFLQLRGQPLGLVPRAAVLQVRVDGRNPRAGTDAFITHMIKPAVQGRQQPCLETVLRGKVGVASLGRTGAVPPAIPDHKRLSQARAGGDYGHGPVPHRFAGIEGVQVIRLKHQQGVSQRLDIVH